MKLYFEEHAYPVASLLNNLGNGINLSYLQNDTMAKVSCVGYFFNSEINDIVFILPKVFVSEKKDGAKTIIKAFDRYENLEDIIDISPDNNPLRDNGDDETVFELSTWLYQAISHYLERRQESKISSDVQIQNVRHSREKESKTIIEIILSLRKFQKKHKELFTYISLVNTSGNNKVHWPKTISKTRPLIKEDIPCYLEFQNKNKTINFDEDLISLFYSVLNYLSQTYHFKFQTVQGYTIMKPSKVESLIESGKGTRMLKKIRHNYFTDELVELWKLLYEFFDRAEYISSGKPYYEKLLVSNFNLVFEDMIDQLISDSRDEIPKELWEQPDGKIVDHIYRDLSIIDEDRMVYCIGDSKYYKETTDLGGNSIYKQFTYAKNIIQYNINVLNNHGDERNCRYRDPLTEGYNITPNFFIRGKIDFNNPKSQEQNITKDPAREKYNHHFENRLFDRDTLFLQTYDINFMFVVASYVNNSDDVALKESIHSLFRKNFLSFINSRFGFSVLVPKKGDLAEAIGKNFKKLIGKIYQPTEMDNSVLLALDKDDKYQLDNLQLISEIQEDFEIYDYKLGLSPKDLPTITKK